MFYAGVSSKSASPRPSARLCLPGPKSLLQRRGWCQEVVTPCLPQTAFSDFLMGSSKDLAKHIRVVVSRAAPAAGVEGQAGEGPPGHSHPPTFPHASLQCDGVDLTPKIQDLKPQCIVFLNIPR